MSEKMGQRVGHRILERNGPVRVVSVPNFRPASKDHLSFDGNKVFEAGRDRLHVARETLSQTLNQANRLIELVQFVRSLRLPSPEEANPRRCSSVHEVVTEVLRALDYEFVPSRITVLKILPSDFPRLPISPDHAESVFFQLILRARRAIGAEAGMITIEAKEKCPDRLGPAQAHRLQIRITDTGPGLSAGELTLSFDPFFTDESKTQVTVIGIYMARKIMELNGGVLRVESSPRGSSFYADFPVLQ